MKLLEFPNLRQTFEYDCGAKAMQSILAYYGIDTSEEKILLLAGTNSKTGTRLQGLVDAAAHFKLKASIEAMSIEKLKKHIDNKIPVIILLQAWSQRRVQNWADHWNYGHYVVAIGYDKNKIYFEDPYVLARTYLTYSELKERWHGWGNSKKEKTFNIGVVIKNKKKRKYSSNKIIHMD